MVLYTSIAQPQISSTHASLKCTQSMRLAVLAVRCVYNFNPLGRWMAHSATPTLTFGMEMDLGDGWNGNVSCEHRANSTNCHPVSISNANAKIGTNRLYCIDYLALSCSP